jgi:phage terminase large subunit GpA-like protein
MMFDDGERLYSLRCLQTRPMMNAADLAVSSRYMPSTSAMFSYDQTPYLYEPTAALSDIAGTMGVVVKSPAQIGKSTMIENFLSWIVEYDRANTMIILDTQKSAEKMSRGRIRPFLRTRGINNPGSSKLKDPDRSNSVVNIGLGSGANLLLCSAKSPSDLRSTPSKFCAFDEVDAWPYELKGEGDPLQNAIQRMMRFRGMYLMTSTPTLYDGRINQNFLLGTQETWGCLCECGAFMDVRFDDIDFSGSEPFYVCKKCGCVYSETDIKSLQHRFSEPKNSTPLDDQYGRILRSFEIFGTLCHHFYSWDYLKKMEIAALSLGEASYQSFRNTRLAEVYKPKDEITIQPPELMRLSMAGYTVDCLPGEVAFLVMGVDTHDSCLYCETCGFSADCKYMFGLDYSVLVGDPNEKEVWAAFEDLFNRTYTRCDGVIMRPVFAFCDSGGHRTNAVYMHSYRNRRFMPIKGYVSSGKNSVDPLIGKQQKFKLNGGIKGRCTVQMIGVNAGKDEIANSALLTIAGDKRLLYIKGCGYDTEYFSGLLSEKKINGKWIAPQKGHTNNEPLDCRVYALACARYYFDKYYSTGLDKESYVDMSKKKQRDNAIDKADGVKPEKDNDSQKDEVVKDDKPKPDKPKFPHL